MNKTLHADTPSLTISSTPPAIPTDNQGVITGLMKEMNPYWQEAAADLLRPRPEVIAQLLDKAAHRS